MDQRYDGLMQRLQAFKFQLQPNGAQERNMRRFAGACRFVYNEALALQKARYERGEKKMGYAGLCELLTEWRNSAQTPWLRDAPTHPSILDQGWYEFRRQLEYKLQWVGGTLIAVPPRNTSQQCPVCGCVSAANRLTQAKFRCVECLHEDNADVVGAINILARGHRVQPVERPSAAA